MNEVYFDDSLLKFVEVLDEGLAPDIVNNGLFVRDATGRLAFFSLRKLSKSVVARLSKEIAAKLGAYARKDRPLADISDFGVDSLFLERPLKVCFNHRLISLLDRRLVGADWLRAPAPVNLKPPRFVFASLKGGVGRTTALSVTAAELAAQGKSVLILDLDLEAPGIGAMLLDEGTTPEFGMIDALVEISLGELSDAFMADLVGPSALADRSGKINVVPAFGRRSLRNAGEVLAKISRAYAEKIDSKGNVHSFLDKVNQVVAYFSGLDRYDAILIDARAGLHETTASALLGLGAHIFLFGLDEPQTFQGYEALLSHLVRIDTIANDKAKWVSGISMVQGKAPREDDLLASYSEAVERLFRKSGLIDERSEADRIPLPAEPFSDVPWVDDADLPDDELDAGGQSVETLCVFYDQEFVLFNPNHRRSLLSRTVYESSYKSLLGKISALMAEYGEEGR
jgi:cellulose biosynthesis protein BcsQ